MRDIKRIDEFCHALANYWHMVPDWRFGQLVYNVLSEYEADTGYDMFYPEDDELLEYLKKYFAPPEKCATISVYGASDDLVEVEGAGKWADEYDCYDQDVIIYFNDCTVLRMHYDGAWKATVENKGASEYTITPLIESDDYYSDLFEIHDTWILNVRKEKAE